jgi:hypothetical protein
MLSSEKYNLFDLIDLWLDDNGYNYEFENYSDFVLLYVQCPLNGLKAVVPVSFPIALSAGVEKRGMMILKDKIQIGLPGPPRPGIVEIQAWDPTIFEQLKAYLS